MNYEVITSRKFRDNMKYYLDLADQGTTVFITRPGERTYRLGVPSSVPSDFAERTKKVKLCPHGRESGLCGNISCKHNPNNMKKNPPENTESSDGFEDLAF